MLCSGIYWCKFGDVKLHLVFQTTGKNDTFNANCVIYSSFAGEIGGIGHQMMSWSFHLAVSDKPYITCYIFSRVPSNLSSGYEDEASQWPVWFPGVINKKYMQNWRDRLTLAIVQLRPFMYWKYEKHFCFLNMTSGIRAQWEWRISKCFANDWSDSSFYQSSCY